MRKNILKILCFLAILFPLNGNASTVSEQRDALMATTWAYYNQKAQLQYDSYRKNLYSTPEDATSMHTVYTVCSGFVFMSYYQTFGIEIPDSTTKLLDYAKKRKSTDNVIFYYEGNEIYTNDVFGVGKDYVTVDEKENFISSIIDKVKPGDIYIYADETGEGHCMMIRSVDKANNKIILMEGNGDRYQFDSRTDITEPEGAINYSVNFKDRIYSNKTRIGLIRIITDGKQFTDIDGNAVNYGLTDSVQTRLQYPNIDIGKIISNVSDQSYAGLGDELTFKLTVRNKGTSVYKNITVTEKFNSRFSVIDQGGGVLNNNQLNWNIATLNPGESVTFNYTLKVKINKDSLGKIMTFEGNVGGIATSKIETRIGDKFTTYEKEQLLKSFNKLKSNTYSSSRSFIKAVYNDAFKINLETDLSNNLNNIYYDPNAISAGWKSQLLLKYTYINEILRNNLYNNYLGLRIDEEFDSVNNIVKASLAWNDYPARELNDRARTLQSSMLEDGDIILAYVGRKSLTDTEFGNKGYIYLNNKLHMYKSADSFEEISGDSLKSFLQSLIGENYIILRPKVKSAISMSITKKPFSELVINNNYNLANGEVTVTYDDETTEVLKLNDSLLDVTGVDNTSLGTKTLKVEYKGNVASYNYKVINKSIIKVTVSTKPAKNQYIYKFENLKVSDGTILVTYNDGSNEKISMTNENVKVSGFDNTKLGKNTITVDYKGYKTTFDVEIINKSITGITLVSKPLKTNYIYNYETLDLTGGIIAISYNDGSVERLNLINDKVKVSGFSNTKLGKNTITVEYSGYKTNFDVEVVNKKIAGITLASKPTKTNYIYNYEALDLTGGVLLVTYNDGSSDKIQLISQNVKVSGFSNTKIGKNTITVEYSGYTTTFDVEVINKKITGIAISTKPEKTKYIYNYETLDLTGGMLLVTYNDGSYDKINLTSDKVKVSGFNNTKIGKKTITVNYSGYTTTFDIEIVNKKITEITVSTKPIKTNYTYKYEILDLTGGVIEILYDDRTTDKISMLSDKIKVSGFDNTKLGKNTIIVEYNDCITSFDVEVVNKKITAITLSSIPSKTTYIYNYEMLDLTDGIILVLYNDGSTDKISMLSESVLISGFDNTKTGINTITVDYNGYTTSFDVEIVDKKVIGIDVNVKPLKTTYIYNYETLDLAGGSISILYDNGSTEKMNMISDNLIISGFNNAKIGKNTITVEYSGYTTTFDVEIVDKKITGIKIITKPSKLNYIHNEENLDLTDGIIEISYNDGSKDKMSITNENIIISGFDNTKLGKNVITIEYNDYITTYDVEIISKKIIGIEVNKIPEKVKYYYGVENLDLTGGVISIKYTNGSYDTIGMIHDDVKIKGFNNKKLGISQITLEYKDFITKFNVEIIERKIVSISLDKIPHKNKYIYNKENIDLAGGLVSMLYNDDTTDVISILNENVKVSGFDNTKLGKNTITVDYNGFTTTYDVEVIDKKVTAIDIIEVPIKTSYIHNKEALDLTGGIISVLYEDGSIDEMSMTNENVKANGFDNTKLGKNTITMEYNGYTVTYEVEIMDKKILNINIIKKPLKINYLYKKQNLDLTGGTISVLYEDGSIDEMSMTNENVKANGFDNTKLGKNTITIEYNGYTSSYDIYVMHDEIRKNNIGLIISIVSLLSLAAVSVYFLSSYKRHLRQNR